MLNCHPISMQELEEGKNDERVLEVSTMKFRAIKKR